MSFDKVYPNRKDRREQYRGSKRFDRACRCHGGCKYCERNRLYRANRVNLASLRDLDEDPYGCDTEDDNE